VFAVDAAQVDALTRGWMGLATAYGAVEASMLGGLVHGRAPLRQFLVSPLIAPVVALASGIGIAVAQPLIHAVGFASSTLQLGAGVGLTLAFGYGAGRAMARRVPVSTQVRGTAIATAAARPSSARRQVSAGLSRSRHRGAAITLAGVPVPARDETKHFKLIGTTGTGKSTAIRELLGAALARGDRAVIADPDGGYLRHLYSAHRGDVILNPFDPASVRWDLFGELANTYDVEQLARSLIPDHEGPDRSWREYARTFFSAVTAQARDSGVNDARELYRLLVVANTGELKGLVAGTPAQPFLEEHNGRMFDSIRSVTSSAVGSLKYIAEQQGAPFSVRRWIQSSQAADARSVLFIPYRAGQIAALRSMISAWMRLAIFEAMTRDEGDQRLWFVVDELDALGQIDGLKDALARLRKFGGRCVLGFQSIAQVSSTYGSGAAQTLVENCGNTLILRCAGSEHGGTSQFASCLIGQREVMRTTFSRSQHPRQWLPTLSQSESRVVEPAVMASEIEQLPDLSGYLRLASIPEWMRVSLGHARASGASFPPPRCERASPHQCQDSPPVEGRSTEAQRDGFGPD
jgi:Type IV secretion-system coupling protein DNA-binding domain